MSDPLPDTWTTTTIEKVVLPFETTEPSKKPNATFTYIDIGSIDNQKQKIAEPKVFRGSEAPSRARRVVKAGDALFSTVRTYLKNIALVPETLDGVLTSTGIAVLRPGPAIDPRYLFHWVRSDEFVTSVGKSEDGTMYPAVRDSDVAGGLIPVAPMPEQRRIVAKLDKLIASSSRTQNELDRIPVLIARYKQAILAKAFSGELTADWRIHHPQQSFAGQVEALKRSRFAEWQRAEKLKPPGARHSRYKEPDMIEPTGLSELPDTWAWLPVDLLASKVVDGVHHKPSYIDQGVPFVTVRNLTAGPGLDFGQVNFVSESDHQEFVLRANPERGDILISKDGTLGVIRAIRTDRQFSIFVSVALVKPSDRKMTDYLELAFQSPQVQNQMVGVGSGLQHIHLTDLRKDFVPIAPFEEQREIVRRVLSALSWIDKIAAEHARAEQLLPKLDQAILAKAFRGELVPQDPNDEPASALLERIKKDAAKGPLKTRRGAKRK